MAKYSKILKISVLFGTSFGALSCDTSSKKEVDKEVLAEINGGVEIDKITAGEWLSTAFLGATNLREDIKAEELLSGGLRSPLSMTYVKANAPIALFRSSPSEATPELNELPYLAFSIEEKAAVTVRHVKTVNGQNIGSQLVLPVSCPENFEKKFPPKSGMVNYCLPLINATIPSFLVPTDNAGAYVHEFFIGFKTGGRGAGVLNAKVACQIVIPGSNLTVSASTDLKSLALADRLTMATNDLVGSPRRDFPAFEVKGSVAPGVQTAWILTVSNLVMTFDEEIFFEQPVSVSEIPARPIISRGASFFKRKTSINSVDQFRLRILNDEGGKITSSYNVASGSPTTQIEIPINDGTLPVRLFISPDFSGDTATKSMSEYVRPFGPSFCPKEQAAFKPEEWRKSRGNQGFIACEAFSRERFLDTGAALKKGITSPIETFFGAFSYLPRLGGNVLGGMNGVLSLRLTMTGNIKVSVRNPNSPETLTVVGEVPLNTSYFLPTAINEIDGVLKASKGTPGMDTILSSMQRKGVFELPRRNGGKTVAFPFMNEEREDLFH